jgi:hypothetical protein
MDLQGRATVVWEGEEAGGDHVIQASSEQIPGGSWTSPADLSAAGADAESAAIATDGFGGAVAVWERPTGGLETVQWAERSPAGSWSVPHVLSSMGEEAKQPRLAVDAAGDAAVIWDHDAGSNDVAEVTTRLAGGEWSAPEDISDPDGESHEARIGIDGQGDALAVWTASEPGGYVVEARETAVGGAAWGDPARISPTSLSELEPSLAMDPAGEAIVTMQATEGEGESVEAVTRAAATGPWSAPTVLSAPSGRATQSAVGVDAEGDAVALWRSYVSSNDNVIQSSDYIADRPPAGGAPAAGGPAPIVDPSPLGVPARTRCPKGKHLAKRKGKGKAKRARRICVKRAPRHHKRHQKPVRNRNSKGKR